MREIQFHSQPPSTYLSAGQTKLAAMLPEVETINITDINYDYIDVNSTVLPATNQEKGIDALLYIIIVLLFYAFSIVILMIKYIRREKEEAKLSLYYREFVSREKFRSPQFENKQYMDQVLKQPNTLQFVDGKNLSAADGVNIDQYLEKVDLEIVAEISDCDFESDSKEETYV